MPVPFLARALKNVDIIVKNKSKCGFALSLLLSTTIHIGRDPFNQNFRAEVRKFLGVEWIATSPNGLVPFHSENEFHAQMEDVGSLLLVLFRR